MTGLFEERPQPGDMPVAESAGLRAENARLRRLLARTGANREAIARFAAIAGETTDPARRLGALAAAAASVFGGRSAAIFLYSADRERTTDAHFAGHDNPAAARRAALAQAPGSIAAERALLATGQPVAVTATPGDAARAPARDGEGHWHLLLVPLRCDGWIAGALQIERDAPFAVADALAAPEVVALAALEVERAAHDATTQRRLVRAEALREIGRQLSAELDFARFLDSAAQHLTTLMDVRDCVLGVWDEADGAFKPALYVCDGVRLEWSVAIRPGEGRGLTSALIIERRTIHVPDYLEECRRRGLAPVALDGDWRGLAWVGVPLLAGGNFVGAIIVERRGRVFEVEEVTTLESLAAQLAAAMENARLYAEVRQLATRDPLTGLANHRHLHEELDRALARAGRTGRPLAVAMLDLDDFKRCNDRHGHQTGDRLLRAVADALRAETRGGDVPGRYGGDEFMLILPDTTDDAAHALLARLRRRLAATPWPCWGADDAPLAISCGIASAPRDATTSAPLIAHADAALYADKAARRGRMI